MRRSVLFLSIVFAILGMTTAAYAQEAQRKRTSSAPAGPSSLVFIIPPVENVSEMYEKFLPLKEHLEKAISRKIVLKIAQNHQEAVESIGRTGAPCVFRSRPPIARRNPATAWSLLQSRSRAAHPRIRA